MNAATTTAVVRRKKPFVPQKPLHERIKVLGWIRYPFRALFFHLLRKAGHTDDGRAISATSLSGLLDPQPQLWEELADQPEPPFPDLGKPQPQIQTSERDDIIFITGRFRSGSTLLWNLFRNIDGYTSYYEPLNERRWFDPTCRGTRIDQTHKGVEDYWTEYDGLTELADYYHDDWVERNMLMGPDFWDPDMKRYVEIMVERAPGRPVLQFNRIDFRLPWFRKQFPNALMIHLYRHPRDQWCSALMKTEYCPANGTFAQFSKNDGFYLRNWSRDLKYHFPFLDETLLEHPYQLYYYVWKLSYLFGRKYSHYSLCFEHLVTNREHELEQLMDAARVENYDREKLLKLIVMPSLGKWKDYAPEQWFRRHEETCETMLARFLGGRNGPCFRCSQ